MGRVLTNFRAIDFDEFLGNEPEAADQPDSAEPAEPKKKRNRKPIPEPLPTKNVPELKS